MTFSPSAPSTGPANDAWATASRLLVRAIEDQERADALLEHAPASLSRIERARLQHLFYGALRHKGRIEAHLAGLVSRAPRTRVQAVLLLAGFELIEGGEEGHVARVVHHAVEQTKRLASPAEGGLVNAVVRKLAAALEAETPPGKLAPARRLAEYFSHPEWLVERWLAQFGAAHTRALLEWNLQPAHAHARWRDAAAGGPPAWLRPTPWAGFYEVPPGHWPEIEALIAEKKIFLQDPATRGAIELLDPQPGEAVLDLCAAPGGKSIAIADRIGRGRVVSVDLAGPRQNRLAENLARAPSGVTVSRVACDVRNFQPAQVSADFAGGFPAVLIDVPCSNTGVIRHRVDVKWRLQPADFGRHAHQQLTLLEATVRYVAPGGRLVYSTCSLEAEENDGVVKTFLKKHGERFELEAERRLFPWSDGHDGACAFRLRRRS